MMYRWNWHDHDHDHDHYHDFFQQHRLTARATNDIVIARTPWHANIDFESRAHRFSRQGTWRG